MNNPRMAAILAGLCSASCGGSVEPDPPQFGLAFSTPVLEADHNRPYQYPVTVIDPTGGTVSITVRRMPHWMSFDPATGTLSGTAGWDQVGTHPVELHATNGSLEAVQGFDVTVVKGEIICDQMFPDPATSPYVLPFLAGTPYDLSQGYCPPNPAWGHHNWFAYDFDMPIGDTIVASRAGTVRAVRQHFADATRVCGEENWVFIGHADGTVMSYVHITTNGALVRVGDTVAQGQPIALSGDSGCSIGPHVHVALFRDATDFNRQATVPLNYSNAVEGVDSRNGLVQGRAYTAR